MFSPEFIVAIAPRQIRQPVERRVHRLVETTEESESGGAPLNAGLFREPVSARAHCSVGQLIFNMNLL